MVRQIHVTVSHELAPDVIRTLASLEHVHGLADYKGSRTHLIVFKSVPKHVSAAIDALDRLGVGVHDGAVDIVALESTKPLLSTFSKRQGTRRRYKLTDRRSVEEIYQIVDDGSHLTFDYILNVCVAALIAGLGLISDSSVTVVASMLVSPLMGPIVCITFGAVVRNKVMIRRGLRNELWGVGLTVLFGLLIGVCAAPFYGPCGFSWSSGLLVSDEINQRGEIGGLVYGLLTAVPSGVGVGIAVTGGGGNALVGVAIAASLLPPIVNSGICLSISMWYSMCVQHGGGDTQGLIDSEARRFAGVSWVSFLLFVGNFLVIFVVAYGVFKMKKVKPLMSRSSFWQAGGRRTSTANPSAHSARGRSFSDAKGAALLSDGGGGGGDLEAGGGGISLGRTGIRSAGPVIGEGGHDEGDDDGDEPGLFGSLAGMSLSDRGGGDPLHSRASSMG